MKLFSEDRNIRLIRYDQTTFPNAENEFRVVNFHYVLVVLG
jgi:hypothetical protein